NEEILNIANTNLTYNLGKLAICYLLVFNDEMSAKAMNSTWEVAFKEDEMFLRDWVNKKNPIPKIGIFVVTYNAVSTLVQTLKRIPSIILDIIEEVFVFDDASSDHTYLLAEGFKKVYCIDKMTVRLHSRNLGYGGNQKAGYQ